MPDWRAIGDALAKQGVSLEGTATAVAGGDINAAWRVESESAPLFIKTGPASAKDMFAAEAEALAELAAANTVRVPAVVASGRASRDAFIALEWLELERPTSETDRLLGRKLASMHRVTRAQFGWTRDNTIGHTPQHNAWMDDWVGFFSEHRLGYQLKLAAGNGYAGELQSLGRKLVRALPEFFQNYEPAPSLLHGDLWSGNRAALNGEPVIFDPATYYGDRESDLAMTRLFGSFSPSFYEAYESAWPLAAGAGRRVELYQLYHLLNHLNLFGSGYESSVMRCLKSLCRG